MQAFLRVYMQIPHVGTMAEPAEVRRSQAGQRVHQEVTAYEHFGLKNAQYVPKYLGHKLEFQSQDSNMVPDGYVEYILWEKLPGVHLTEHAYWDLTASERDAIIGAFKTAY